MSISTSTGMLYVLMAEKPVTCSGISNAISISFVEPEINGHVVFNTKSSLLNSFEDRRVNRAGVYFLAMTIKQESLL